MADTQHNVDHCDVEQFFDLENYYEGSCAEPDRTFDSGLQAPNDSRRPCQISELEPSQVEVTSSKAAAVSPNDETMMTDVSFESLGGRAQPANDTRNEVLHDHEHPSGTDSPSAEIVHIDNRIEEIDLMLERRRLQKRRQAILQNLPETQQEQTSERPEFQTISMANDSRTQCYSQDVASDEASKKSDSFPTGIVPLDKNWVDYFYDANFSTSDNDPIQTVPVDTDFHSGVAFTDPSNSGFADLPNNAFGGSSHIEALEHFDNAGTGLSNLGSLHPFDGLPAGPPNCGSNTQHGVQGPLSALATDQTTMQSSLTNLHHRPNLNSDPQHASTLSSLQHERPLHNSETSMIVRKRPASPRPTQLQRLSAIQHQLAKKTGVPEISLGVICFDTESQPKRRRTSSQKRSKKDVEDAGGSCFLCLVFKKKCSCQRPCDSCRKYWEKRVHSSTSFMWTCNVHTKLTDFKIFNHSLEGISESETITQFGGLKAFMQKFGYLFDLIDSLEPLGAKFLLRKTHKHTPFLYSYTHAILGWVRVLVYLVPGLQHALAFIRRLYRSLSFRMLDLCDQLHKKAHKFWAVIISVVLFDEIKRLTSMEISDPSAVDHVQLVLKSRLTFFCSRIFDESKVDLSKDDSTFGLAMVVNRVQELSFCLPQNYRTCLPSVPGLFIHVPDTPLGLPACLLRRFDSGGHCYENEQTDHCCCGWASDSTPSGFLSLFGHSARSFGRYIHSGPHKIIFTEREIILDTLHIMDTVFGGPWVNHLSLYKSKVIFGVALSVRLRELFSSMSYIIENYIKEEFPKDILDCLAKYFRAHFFAHILRSAVALYSEFLNSREQGELEELEVDSYQMLVLRVYNWMGNRKDPKDENFRRGVFGIVDKGIQQLATMTKSPDTDISSTADDSSDELE